MMNNFDHFLTGDKRRVALVTMPWAQATEPSLPMGLMHASLQCYGHITFSFSFHLEFFNFLSNINKDLKNLEGYQLMSTNYGLGEWVFSVPPLSSLNIDRDMNFIQKFKSQGIRSEDAISYAISARKYSEAFVQKCAEEIINCKPDVIVIFPNDMEYIPSLLLAAVLSGMNTSAIIGLGGPSCDEPFGTNLRAIYSFIDFVMPIDTDMALMQTINEYKANTEHDVIKQKDNGKSDLINDLRIISSGTNRDDKVTLNSELPIPFFNEYFDRLNNCNIKPQIMRMLWIPFETSRGCWWAEKTACSFCALTGSAPRFRLLRNPKKSVEQLISLAAQHSHLQFHLMDWIQHKTEESNLFELLLNSGVDIKLYLQVRPSVSRKTLEILSKLDCNVQLGVESLSTSVLKKMKKGTSTLQCIRCLRWCAEIGVKVNWNLIYDFPETNKEDALEMIKIIPSLIHLSPPDLHRFRLKRLSPLFDKYKNKKDYDLQPCNWYEDIYPNLDQASILSISDEFECISVGDDSVINSLERIKFMVEDWKQLTASNYRRLSYQEGPGFILIHDYRSSYGSNRYTLRDPERMIYLACMQGLTINNLINILHERSYHIEQNNIAEFLDELVSDGLMYMENGNYLALAVKERNL